MGLFKPAWMSKDERKALSAVARETNPEILADIAQAAALSTVRIAAIEKIKDHHLLVDTPDFAGQKR